MAETTHSLRLKAVLDTKEVQQELAKLRNMQQEALSQPASSKTATTGNLGNLGSVIGRLNASISQLNRTVSQLAATTRTIGVQSKAASVASNATQSNPIGFIPLGGGQTMQQAINSQVLKTLMKNGPGGLQSMYDKGRTGTGNWTDRAFFRAIDVPNDVPYDTWASYWRKNTSGYRDALRNSIVPTGRRNFLKPMAGLAMHQIAPMAQQSFEMAGWNDNFIPEGYGMSMGAGDLIGGLGKIGGYAAMGSVAGPWGTAIGAAVGAVETIFDAITKGAKEAQQQLDEWNQSVARAQQYKGVRKEFGSTQELNEAMRKASEFEDPEMMTRVRDRIQAEADKNKKLLEIFDRSAKSGSVASNAMDVQNEYAKQIAQLQQIDDLRKRIIQKQEDEKKQEAEIAKKIAERNEEMRKSYIKQADNLWKQYKHSVEERENRGDKLSNPDDRYNYYTKESKKYEAQYKDTVYQATYAGSAEEAKSLLEKAQQIKDNWDFNQSQADFFGNESISRLQEKLSNLKAPDMGNVGSLAANGFMTNKAVDDQKENMEFEYLRTQVELQREIRNKMNDLESGSTFQ